MPNQITSTGIQTKTATDLIAELTTAMKNIYGSDINVDSDSPDGQMINIFVQSSIDNLELIQDVYNSFNPDSAVGVTLDQRVALNGLVRQGGTYTITPITITASQACTLYGLDQSVHEVYTVSDSSGNNWKLKTTEAIPAVGTYIFNFQAENPGKVSTTINTITIPVSIVLGVSSINNPTTYLTLGIDEETDSALRLRRSKSVSLVSTGYQSSLIAALKNIVGVSDAYVLENVTASVDSDAIPPHSIWVIISGSAAASDIAYAIYAKRNAGCGMKGTLNYSVTQADGTRFIVKWDSVTYQDLYIKFNVTSIDGVNAPYIDLIRDNIASKYVPGVYKEVDINSLGTTVQSIEPNTFITQVGGSTGVFSLSENASGFTNNFLLPTTRDKQFLVDKNKVIILPMILKSNDGTLTVDNSRVVSSQVTIPHSTTESFIGQGGFGSYTYSKDSGLGSIDSSTGVFTASSTPGTVVVRVTDSQGNYALSTITVS